MKHLVYTVFLSLTAAVIANAQTGHTPDALLRMTKRLTTLRSISYRYHREIKNSKDNYFNVMNGVCYVEFDQADERSVSRFRMETDDYISIYNGAELFGLSKQEKTYRLTEQPSPRSLGDQTFFFNSIPTLRSVAQQLVVSDAIPKYQRDTIIDNNLYKIVQINMHRSSLQYLGSTMQFTKEVTIFYNIIIDPASWLPYQVLESNDIDRAGYHTRTVFTDIDLAPKELTPSSWYYSSYQGEYQPEAKPAVVPLITPGSIITSGWTLPEYNGKANPVFNSSYLQGKLVLLDFWIKNCGPCMESFPVLQALQKKYGCEKFQILSINAYDKREEIAFFYRREKPLYKMLYQGAEMAKSMGVSAYPTAMLIDGTGKVIYAGAFDHEVIEHLIRARMRRTEYHPLPVRESGKKG